MSADKRGGAPGDVVALLGDGGAQVGELREVGAQRVGLALQLGDRRAKHSGGANRLRHVLRPHQNGRRRIAAHTLQHRQHIGDHRTPIVERAGQGAGVGVERVHALVGGDDLPLGVLHLGGGVDQRRVEPRPVGAQELDFSLNAPTLLVGGA